MVSRSSIASRFKMEFLAKSVTAILGALLTVLLARLLNPDGYGLLFLALSFFAVAKIFSKAGIAASSAKYITEYKEKQPEQVPNIIRIGFKYVFFLSLAVSVIILLGRALFSEVISEPGLAPFLALGAVFVFSKTMHHFARKMLQAHENIADAAKISIVSSVLRFVLAIGLVVAGFGALGALVGYVISALVAALIGLILVYYLYLKGEGQRQRPVDGLRRRIAEYAFPLTATNSATAINSHLDTLLVGYFLNPAAVSYYALSKQIVRFVETPASALGFTLAPTFSAGKVADNNTNPGRTYERALTNILLFYLPAAAGLILVAEPVITLIFGTDYVGAIPVLQVLGIYTILMASNYVAASALDYLGRARDRAIIKTITSVLNFGLNLVLIPIFGVVGAAVATIITYSLYALANFYLISLELTISFRYLGIKTTQIMMITAIMSLAVYFLLSYISGLVTLFAVVVVGVFIWGALSVGTGLIDYADVKQQISI